LASSPEGLAWSPDGARVATTEVAEIVVWNSATGARLHAWKAPATETPEGIPTWTADGKTVFATTVVNASLDGERRLRSWSVDGWSLRGPWSGVAFAVTADGAVAFVSEFPRGFAAWTSGQEPAARSFTTRRRRRSTT
jgi:hypothetical protein